MYITENKYDKGNMYVATTVSIIFIENKIIIRKYIRTIILSNKSFHQQL